MDVLRFNAVTFFFFFFQAEDGIRDTSVTGVQTCALPISATGWCEPPSSIGKLSIKPADSTPGVARTRSEERRVGKECRSRGSPDRVKKKKKTYKIGRMTVHEISKIADRDRDSNEANLYVV